MARLATEIAGRLIARRVGSTLRDFTLERLPTGLQLAAQLADAGPGNAKPLGRIGRRVAQRQELGQMPLAPVLSL